VSDAFGERVLGADEQAERVDYSFKISDVINKQHARNGS